MLDADERTALIAERAGLLDLVARLHREVRRLRDEIGLDKVGGRCPGRKRKVEVEVEVQEEAMA